MHKQVGLALCLIFGLVTVNARGFQGEFSQRNTDPSTMLSRPLLIGPRVVTPTPRDVKNLADEMLKNITIDLKRHRYPEFVEIQLNWLMSKFGNYVSGPYMDIRNYDIHGDSTLINVGMANNNRYMRIQGGRFWYWIRIEGQMETGFTTQQQDSFALFLVHESVHLQAEPMQETRTLDEEMRAYQSVASNATRVMRDKFKLDRSLLEDDNVFAKCRYSLDCQSARDYIKKKAGLK